MEVRQIDCFKINMKFWRFLAIWPGDSPYYRYYSKTFLILFIYIYYVLLTINFYFLPRQLDIFIEEMIFYFTELSVFSKVLTFLFFHDEIENILDTLECETFRADADIAHDIINRAKAFTVKYWRIVAGISIISNLTHVLSPFITHLFLPIKLELPVCSYSFLSDKYKDMFIYPLYLYQSFGIHCHMLYNLNIDTFFLGLMVLAIAQLNILDIKLRNVTVEKAIEENRRPEQLTSDKEKRLIKNLNQCIIHYDVIAKFCGSVETVFSMTLFVQFSMASCIICVCLFRFTLAAPFEYYIFLATYMAIMLVQIMVPCWFGTQIIETSNMLSLAIYHSDWTPRCRQFKSNLRCFVERANRPLSIIGGKMFPLSLATFTSIMNSAYSFFTLLRHMQTRDA